MNGFCTTGIAASPRANKAPSPLHASDRAHRGDSDNLSEYRLASGLECLDALPSMPDMIWRIVAAHALTAKRLGEAIDLGLELAVRASHVVLCEGSSRKQAASLGLRLGPNQR